MGKRLDVKRIVKKYLDDNGFDGLIDTFAECGCTKDDLFPCSEIETHCEPGYKVPCDCENKCDFHIALYRVDSAE